MEYTLTTYKQNRGTIYETSDGYKYISSKRMVVYNYLGLFESVLFRNGCNSTAKLDHDSNLISIISWHNHGHSEFNNDIYLVEAKCKEAAKTSRYNL